MKTLVFLLSALAISTVSLKNTPSLRAGRGHGFVRHGAVPLLLTNDNREPALYENTQYRKKTDYNVPIILVKKNSLPYKKKHDPKKFKVAFLKRNNYENLFDEKGMLYLTRHKDKPQKGKSNYERLFDDKGMLLLTKREDEDRNLNKLIKTADKYQIDDGHKESMKSDFRQDGLWSILQAINTEDRGKTTARIVYDFAELVA